jgi:PEP-CTERM motif
MLKNRLFGGAAIVAALTVSAGAASAAGFINGGFEDGTINGWTQAGGNRAGIDNTTLSPATLASSGTADAGRGQIMNVGDAEAHVSTALFDTTVYSGNHSYRVEDTTTGGFATVLSQTVNNYTDPDIFFAWKSVLLGAHGTSDAATMIITLTDLTTSTELIRRQYNAASGGGGVDPRFSYDATTNNFYTPQWQIEQLTIDGSLQGHNFALSVLGSDCQPTGHWGYVYVDGFGSVAPPPGPIGGIPEPSTWAMLIAGMGLTGAALRRRRGQPMAATA